MSAKSKRREEKGIWRSRDIDHPSAESAAGCPRSGDDVIDAGLVSRSFMIETNGAGSIEPVPGFRKQRAMSGGLPEGRPPSVRELRPESAFGEDSRAEIADTTGVPWRSICHLLIERQDGTNAYGTGWLAGPNLVVTAGHCVVDHDHGGWATRVTAVPGGNGAYPPPFGTLEATRVEASARWEVGGDPRADYGFVVLGATDVGSRLGWFGFAALSDAQVQSMLVNVAGYPDDKPRGTMWFNAGRINKSDPDFLYYLIDTKPGQSGAPVFWYGSEGQRLVVGIHAYGDGDGNRGVRITSEIYGRIKELRGE